MTNIVNDLRLLESGARWVDSAAADVLERAADEIERLRLACTKMNDEVCQRLGKALGYPWFKDDQENFTGATEESGVCTGEHVAESIAAEAARRIGNLEAELDEAIQRGNDWCDQAQKARAERDRLREALRYIVNDGTTNERQTAAAHIAHCALEALKEPNHD
jgi:hypothetical protein